jgi:transcriptional regulator with XRE-family HTH domain
MSELAALEASYEEHERVRTGTLTRLIQELRDFPSDGERASFAQLFQRAQALLEQEDAELATLFKVSRPTIGRWARGESAPHPLGRKPVFMSLLKIAKVKLGHHRSSVPMPRRARAA